MATGVGAPDALRLWQADCRSHAASQLANARVGEEPLVFLGRDLRRGGCSHFLHGHLRSDAARLRARWGHGSLVAWLSFESRHQSLQVGPGGGVKISKSKNSVTHIPYCTLYFVYIYVHMYVSLYVQSTLISAELVQRSTRTIREIRYTHCS